MPAFYFKLLRRSYRTSFHSTPFWKCRANLRRGGGELFVLEEGSAVISWVMCPHFEILPDFAGRKKLPVRPTFKQLESGEILENVT